MGDDLTYWTFAYDLHDIGLKAFNVGSFHDLRWPVWGVSWILQGCGLQGISAYTGVAVIYLMAGAACAFTFGRLIFRSLPLAWAAGLAFVMCPIIDTECHRPMPDLSEGVWGGATLLAWWGLMHAKTRRSSLGWAVLTGLGVYITESNRLTGVFIVPVLLLATLLFARRRFWWLVAAGGWSVVFYACEGAFYYSLFHDWLHNLHANMTGAGDKGVEHFVALTSPIRFLYVFYKVGNLAPLYSFLAVIGLISLAVRRWWPRQDPIPPSSDVAVPAGPLMALWFGVLYFEYSCAPQSIHPYLPVIRDASRFLGGLAMPFSILAVIGLRTLLIVPWRWAARGRWAPAYPIIAGAAGLAALIALTSRPFFNLGYLKYMSAYVRRVPPGTRVLTHHMMRALAIMSDPSAAKRIVWWAPPEIMNKELMEEHVAAVYDEFWYMHKVVWTGNRKRMEKKRYIKQPPLASYFANPDEHWALAHIIIKDAAPDLVFYRRRTPAMPAPVTLTAASPEFGNLIPTPPAVWSAGQPRSAKLDWAIPPDLRGKCVRLDPLASSDEVEGAFISFRFSPAKGELLWKPYLYPEPGHDFFLLAIPQGAEHCAIRIRFSKSGKLTTLADFSATVSTPLDGISWVSARHGKSQ